MTLHTANHAPFSRSAALMSLLVVLFSACDNFNQPIEPFLRASTAQIPGSGSGVNPAGAMVAYLASSGTFYPTLQAAVSAATGTSAVPDTITLLRDVDIAAEIPITGTQHIRLIAGGVGTGRTISRGGSYRERLISVASGGSLELGGDTPLTIDGKTIPADAALIRAEGTLKMGGSVTLKKNNITGIGGGVLVFGGIFTMDGGSITANTAVNGGGVGVVGGAFTMSGGTISGNQATAADSGDTGKGGGGVYVNGGTFTMLSSSVLINSNTANANGGGILIYGGTVIMVNGTISANSAKRGGGVAVYGENTVTSIFTKTGGIIYGSNAPNSAEKNIATDSTKGNAVRLHPSSGWKYNWNDSTVMGTGVGGITFITVDNAATPAPLSPWDVES